jgi:endo-1,4-beta-D-glucanase Y
VSAAYAKWKADLVTSSNANGHLKIQRTATDTMPSNGCLPLGSSVSEGIGYGMLIAALMNDQTVFDGLWLYEQQHLDAMGLMNWAPDGPSGNASCGGGATDADEDMAFALVLADQQWPGQNAIGGTYHAAAVKQIQAIWNNEIDQYKYPKGGDWSGFTSANLNPSYFAPAYYRVFAQVDPKACAAGVTAGPSNACDGWLNAIDQSYATINDALNAANGNQSNGLVPGWCDDSKGAPCASTSQGPFSYQYDACRMPFRVALDWCWFAEPRAQAYVAKTSAFFSGIGASHIVDGYALSGTPMPQNPGKLSATFIGPAGVGAMAGAMGASTYQSFVNDAYSVVAADTAFAGGEYYESSWTVMSLLMMSGNFLDYTHQTPAH